MDALAKAAAAAVAVTATATRPVRSTATPLRAMAMATTKAVAAAASAPNAAQTAVPKDAHLKPAHPATWNAQTTAKTGTAVAGPRARQTHHCRRPRRAHRNRAASAHPGVNATNALTAARSRAIPTATAAASANRVATRVNVHPAHRPSKPLCSRPILSTPRRWHLCPIWIFPAMSPPLVPPHPRAKPNAVHATAMAVTVVTVVNAGAVAHSAKRRSPHRWRRQMKTAPPLPCRSSTPPQRTALR